MRPFHLFMGSNLLHGDAEIETPDFTKKKFWGIYFSASWCNPCQYFTPILIDFYNKVRQNDKNNFEIVYVSKDENIGQFNSYYRKMPWLAVPFGDRPRINLITSLLKPRGVPALYIFDSNGQLLTHQGTQFVDQYGVQAYQIWLDALKEKQ